MNKGERQLWMSFRTGARSGMNRSPRTNTNLELMVDLWVYHWLLEGSSFASPEEGNCLLTSTRPHAEFENWIASSYNMVLFETLLHQISLGNGLQS